MVGFGQVLQDWIEVKYIFREQGIYFELRDWCYFCLIEGRQYYYSPSSGKWRMKGQRAWQTSKTPEDFIAQAKAYSPPKYQSNQSQSKQKKTERKQTKKKTYSYRHNAQNQQQQSSGESQKIREEFLKILGLTFPFTLQELKRAYHQKALETHPDSGGNAEAFRSVQTAYQNLVLSFRV